ncbi:MAG: hypothetical protein WB780_08295, partial [Candidatus Acidiferrales bacterium]
MRQTPAIKKAVSLLCIFLTAGAGIASAAPPTSRSHRSRGVPSYADPGKNDTSTYDDPIVRQIAVDALGHTNGSVLAMDPATGRILTIVNQKMAFSAGFEPCSTIK